MHILINLFFIFNTQAADVSGISRSPAVLANTCDLNVSTENLTLIEIHKEQCKRVRQCMNSAPDEEMPGLKKLESLACKNELVPVTTAIPKMEVNKALIDDNSRKEKVILPVDERPKTPASTSTIDK